MTEFSADYLRRLMDAVDAFMTAFDDWMTTQHESDHVQSRGLLPTASQRSGVDDAVVRERELAVAEAAGLAAKAVAVTGTYIMVQGVGAIDPIANWTTMSQPRSLLSPADVRRSAASIRGRLKGMIDEADIDGGSPSFGPSALHELVWTAAAPYWTSHRRRVAVREAAEALTMHWKAKLGRSDAEGTSFWQQTLKNEPPAPGVPRLRWPGADDDKTVSSIRGGLGGLAAGLNLVVRNVATHGDHEPTEQEALEQLGAYSHLARLLDECEVVRHVDDGSST